MLQIKEFILLLILLNLEQEKEELLLSPDITKNMDLRNAISQMDEVEGFKFYILKCKNKNNDEFFASMNRIK